MGNSILSCFCVTYCSSYLEHSSLPSPCSKSTARSSTSASLWTKPHPPNTHTHPAPIPSCSRGNTPRAPAMTGLTSRLVASLGTSLLSPCGGHVAPGLLPAMTECDGSLRTALRLALGKGLLMAGPELPWAALSSSQPSIPLSFTQGSGCRWAWWLSQVFSAPSLFSQNWYPLINPCTISLVLESASWRTQTDIFPGVKEYSPSPETPWHLISACLGTCDTADLGRPLLS